MKIILINFFIGLFLVQFTLACAQDKSLSDYRWTTLEVKGEATPRHESSLVEYKGKFYLLGGRGVNPVNVFDPQTNTWETKGKTPMEIHHFQAVVYQNAIYFIGAMTGKYPEETPLENIWIYYPEKDSWEKGASIPKDRRRGGAGAVVYRDKIYLVCGIDFGHTSGTNNNFDSYDLKTGEWEVLTKAPHIRDHFSVVVVDDRLYCVGGRNTSFHHSDGFTDFFEATTPYVDVYDFKTGKWRTMREKLPYPTAAGGLINVGNKIIYAGGEGAFPVAYNQTQCLDLETGKWSQLAPLNIGRHGGGIVLFNDKIYMAAGSPNRGGGNMNSVEVFSADHEWQSLFNGKNLEGWEIKCTEKDRDKDFWMVENGAILCNSMGSKNHQYIWLYSAEEYDDFELRLKFQDTRGNLGNSGVQVRSRYDEKAQIDGDVIGWLDGPQVDINPGGPWRNGFIYDETRKTRRWIHPSLPDWRMSEEEYAPKKWVHYFEDEGPGWNDLTIICKGNHVKTIVNNVVVSDYDGAGVLDDAVHKKLGISNKGHIALQLHKNSENKIRFKDIEIRKL